MPDYDWDNLRIFLELVRSGNAYDAAKVLKIDHTTVRRRVRAFETALKARAFEPSREGIVLTPVGKTIAAMAEEIDHNIRTVMNSIADDDQAMIGKLRIGCPDGFGAYFLAPRLVQLRKVYPELQIELLAASRQFNIASREAEIGIAISRPKSSRHYIRKLGQAKLRMYASSEYLGSRDPIETVEDLPRHELIGYLRDHPFIPEEVKRYSGSLGSIPLQFGSNSVLTQLHLALNGGGICLLPNYLAQHSADLLPVLHDDVVIPVDFFLLIHADLRHLLRYRVVADFIIERVAERRDLFN